MTTKTLKHRIGNYLFKTLRVPMRDEHGQLIRYKNGKIRTRHLKDFKEFLTIVKPELISDNNVHMKQL